jgi:hypothetical protein
MKRIALLAYLLLVVHGLTLGQEAISIKRIEEKPHEDIRISYQQLRDPKVKHGKYILYHRGVKLVEGNYIAGKKHGKWYRYHSN